MKSKSSYPVSRDNIRNQWGKFIALFDKVDWTPHRNANTLFSKQSATPTGFIRSGSQDPQRRSSSLLNGIKKITGDPLLVDPCSSVAVSALRTGFALGFYIFEQYCKASGLDNLVSLNASRNLPVGQQPEFHSKLSTGSAIALFCTASYIKWELSAFEPEKVAPLNVEFKGVPEIELSNPAGAAACQLFYISWHIEESGAVTTPHQIIKMLLLYADSLISEIQSKVESMKYAEAFTQSTYQIEGTDFAVSGFEESANRIVVVGKEFNRVEFATIVGNHEAKHYARQLAKRLACYDPVAKSNPFTVLGGLSAIRIGHGKPGTGKSLQIAATATLCSDLCEKRGLPFIFHPLPDTVISTFQGGSGERMMEWFKVMQQSSAIVYAPIDDGENNLEDRTRQGVSSGVREVIGVFLRNTEGAGAINHGNWAIDVMTNLPEQIDPAVMSRIQGRFPIDGATSATDFADQDYLWWKKLQEVDPKFIDVTPWGGHRYLETQGELKNLLQIETGDVKFGSDKVKGIVEGLLKEHTPKEDRFFAELFDRVKREYPGFTSRDVRNIQTAVNLRVMDFDVPDEWFEEPKLFFELSFDLRIEALRDLMRQNMKGMSFADLRYREAVMYIDRKALVGDIEYDRGVESRIQSYKIDLEARKRLEVR